LRHSRTCHTPSLVDLCSREIAGRIAGNAVEELQEEMQVTTGLYIRAVKLMV
jgi:hypothetical protein